MKTMLIVFFAAANWGSNSYYNTYYPSMEECQNALKNMRIVQPNGGDKNAVTVTAFCAVDDRITQPRICFDDVTKEKCKSG